MNVYIRYEATNAFNYAFGYNNNTSSIHFPIPHCLEQQIERSFLLVRPFRLLLLRERSHSCSQLALAQN